MKFANRVEMLGEEAAFEVLALAQAMERKGADVVHFEIGEPDFDTPEHIKQAAIDALKKGLTHYTPTPGLPELREAIAERIREDYGVDVKPEEVLVMPGAKPGIFYSLLAIVEEGDEVILPNPGFPAYENAVKLAGGKPVYVPLREEKEFRITYDDIVEKLSERTKAIIINSPHNPCGSMLTPSDIRDIAELAKKKGFYVLSDEVYSKLVYEGEFRSLLNELDLEDGAIVIDGFSKTYAMTGWRLGYCIANKDLIRRMSKLQNNSVSCVPAFVQVAGIAALRGPQECVKEMVRQYKERRDVIVNEINRVEGFSCQRPKGAFYAFVNVKKYRIKSYDLMKFLLENAKVAVLHGSAMGSYGEGYLRFSYATSIDKIREGFARIRESLKKLG
ncbi:MAG: pyridoxal phosphate-dependent aminotransferase [Candidatus Methanomethylicota archaeon]|uniref:Aminotransferase n=2 Tax=Thermoproteota archaeon TaxID=2056631 RepID=A0A497ERI5_9CREN|nr:MAG: pyridoxal phosphate-dependent aminotransferase [Candidatus Verstraetearchaeota archaeon]